MSQPLLGRNFHQDLMQHLQDRNLHTPLLWTLWKEKRDIYIRRKRWPRELLIFQRSLFCATAWHSSSSQNRTLLEAGVLKAGLGKPGGTMRLEGNTDSWKRTAAICFMSIMWRRGGRGPGLGAFGVWGLDPWIAFPSPLLHNFYKNKQCQKESTEPINFFVHLSCVIPHKRPMLCWKRCLCIENLLSRTVRSCVIEMKLPGLKDLIWIPIIGMCATD